MLSSVPVLRVIALVALVLAGAPPTPAADAATLKPPAMPTNAAAVPGALLWSDDFAAPADLAKNWTVEQQPGGTVAIRDGRLIIEDAAGCTVWFNALLRAPVIITYEATVSSRSRVSDLNCFWMAGDPQAGAAEVMTHGFGRSGKFADYDTLRTYYVGYGGNTNSTTRFRRYAGDGTKPLLPEHDLRAKEFLLVPDHTYQIALIAAAGRAQFIRDGEVVFDFRDPAPWDEGRFGFRTVHSRIEIGEFRVWAGTLPARAN